MRGTGNEPAGGIRTQPCANVSLRGLHFRKGGMLSKGHKPSSSPMFSSIILHLVWFENWENCHCEHAVNTGRPRGQGCSFQTQVFQHTRSYPLHTCTLSQSHTERERERRLSTQPSFVARMKYQIPVDNWD